MPVQNLPAPRQVGLNPPSYSVSWETSAPQPTENPEDPGEPGDGFPVPTPSNQISLYPPSYSISWDAGTPAPQPTEDPEDPEEPGFPAPVPTPSNQISLNPPSYSVSWDTPVPPQPTKKPWTGQPGRPTRRPPGLPSRFSISWFTGRPKNTGGVSWDAGVPDNTAGVTWDGAQPTDAPEKPQDPSQYPIDNQPKPSDQISNNPPTNTVIWGKRQYEEDPEPTEEPEPEPAPEDPEGPIIIPPFFPTQLPPNTIGIQPPQVSFSWGKRQEDEPTGPVDIPPPPQVTPPDQISIQPPVPSVSWGKRQEDEPTGPIDIPPPPLGTPPNQISMQTPSKSISWGKRQEEPTDGPIEIPPPPQFTPPDEISMQPPSPSISWGKRAPGPQTNSYGFEFTRIIPSFSTPKVTMAVSWHKRQDDAEPTDDPIDEFPLPAIPTPSDDIGIQPPAASMSWGKRDPEPQSNSWGFHFPTYSFAWPKPPKQSSAYISWGKRQDEEPEPTEDPVDELPAPAQPTPPDDIGMQPPTATVIWGRDAQPEPQGNEIGFQPPKATVIWGKEKRDPEPQGDDIGMQPPTASVIWGKEKRDAEADPQFSLVFPSNVPFPSWDPENPWWPKPSQPYVSWGKRDAVPEPTAAPVLEEPKEEAKRDANPEAQFSLNFPSNYPFPWWPQPSQPFVSWGKRDAAPEPTAAPNTDNRKILPRDAEAEAAAEAEAQFSIVFPSNYPRPTWYIPKPSQPYVSWGKRDVASEPTIAPTPLKPTPVPIGTLATSIVGPRPSGLCPTITALVAPPCVPPICPHATETPCDYNKPIPAMKKVRKEREVENVEVVEKTIVTIKTFTPTGTPTSIIDKCTQAVTKTIYGTCPTYTCVPWSDCDVAQIVR